MKKLITIILLTASAILFSSCTINMKVTVEQMPNSVSAQSDSTSINENYWF